MGETEKQQSIPVTRKMIIQSSKDTTLSQKITSTGVSLYSC